MATLRQTHSSSNDGIPPWDVVIQLIEDNEKISFGFQ